MIITSLLELTRYLFNNYLLMVMLTVSFKTLNIVSNGRVVCFKVKWNIKKIIIENFIKIIRKM